MGGKLIKLENEYYLTTEAKVEKGDYGLAFAHGGRNGFGRGWYIFYHDGRPVNKLNAICAGTRKITRSTAPIDGDEVGSSFHIIEQLSLKNCQAIELGYDLDELARQEAEKIHIKSSHEDWGIWEELVRDDARSIKIGMEKIIEILGDKKYTEDDVNLAFVLGKNKDESRINKLINSKLQQTEWDVEIVTEPYVKYVNSSVYPPLGIQNKLDAEGNLILKRK